MHTPMENVYNLKPNIIYNAVEAANQSEYYQKVGAVIFKCNRIISIGFNVAQRSVKHLHPKFQRWPGSIHAEVDAIIRAKTDVKGYDLLVIRVNNNNEFRLSKPCKYCRMYLNYIGIRKIYYSIAGYPHIKKLEEWREK